MSHSGLDAILKKLAAAPNGVLVERFLALVAEMSQEKIKIGYLLELAKVLLAKAPLEAIRVAKMVYDLDPNHIESLDVMIEGLKRRGRFAKAEVLMGEKERLLGGRGDTSIPQVAMSEPLSPPPPSSPAPPSELMGIRRAFEKSVDFLFGGEPKKEETASLIDQTIEGMFGEGGNTDYQIGEASMTNEAAIYPEPELRPEGFPGFISAASPQDTVLPPPLLAGDKPAPVVKVVESFKEPEILAVPWVKAAPASPQPPTSTSLPAFKDPPPKVDVKPNSEPLHQAFKVQDHEVTKPRKVPSQGSSSKSRRRPVTISEFWGPIHLGLRKLSKGTLKEMVLPLAKPLSDAQKSSMTLMLSSLTKESHHIDLAWGLLEAVVTGGVPQGLSSIIGSLKLDSVDNRFWGLYLDALLIEHNGRKALYIISSGLNASPTLERAHIAMRRLPAIWEMLGMTGFNWKAEEGVGELIKKLEQRPTRKPSKSLFVRNLD